jgi:hypothetical protein
MDGLEDGRWRSTELLRLGGLVEMIGRSDDAGRALWEFVAAWHSRAYGLRMWRHLVWAASPLRGLEALQRQGEQAGDAAVYVAFRFVARPFGEFYEVLQSEADARTVEGVRQAMLGFLTPQLEGVAHDGRLIERSLEKPSG